MTTITISKKEYLKIIKTQEKLEEKLDLLQKMFKEEIQDEIRPEYVKKLDRIDAEIDKGKGVKFSSISEMKKYLRSL